MNEFKIATTKINGCMYGLLAKFGPHARKRLLKTWIFATRSEPLRQVNLLSNHQYKHPPVCGKNALISENYPTDLAKAVHKVFAETVASTCGSASALPASGGGLLAPILATNDNVGNSNTLLDDDGNSGTLRRTRCLLTTSTPLHSATKTNSATTTWTTATDDYADSERMNTNVIMAMPQHE